MICTFLMRATIGTSLYIWLRQSVSYLVRKFMHFCFYTMSHALAKTTSDGTNRTLAKFYENFGAEDELKMKMT